MISEERAVRCAVVLFGLELMQTPYRWNGKDIVRDYGLDCSGFVELCLAAAGIVLPERNSDGLWRTLPALDPPAAAGDLAFYGDSTGAHHVVIVLGPGGSAIIGANGGGPPLDGETPDAYSARMANLQAGVRIEDWRHGGARYRKDF